MQEALLLSVTIATFNVEKYIAHCLDSILAQTFTDFELICIDDGSKDKTVEIMQQYAAKDPHIRVIANSVNQGLAVVRNQSLREAKGKYVFFLDGDDLYDPTYFEKAVQLAEDKNSDVVMCDYLSFYKVGEIEGLRNQPSALLNVDPTDKIALLQRPAFAWVKLFKTDTARKLGVYFPPGYTRQDIPVHWHMITATDKIALLPEKLTFYRQQPEATTAKKDKKLFHLAFIMDIVHTYLKENNLYETYKKEFLRQQLNLLHGMYDNVKEEYKAEALSLVKERITPEHYSYLQEKNNIRNTAKYFYLGLQGDTLSQLKLKAWQTMRSIYRKSKS